MVWVGGMGGGWVTVLKGISFPLIFRPPYLYSFLTLVWGKGLWRQSFLAWKVKAACLMINSISSWQVMGKLKPTFDTVLPLISTLWSYFENGDLKNKCSHWMHFPAIANINVSTATKTKQKNTPGKVKTLILSVGSVPAADSVSCFLLT